MITSEKINDELTIIFTASRIDVSIAVKFRELLSQEIYEKPQKVILDCSKLEYLDSSALRVLVTFMKEINYYGGHLVLKDLSTSFKSILQLSKLDQLFEIHDDR